MKLHEPDPRRVRVQVLEILPGTTTTRNGLPGAARTRNGKSMVVFGTTAEEVMRIIKEALREAADDC